MDDRFGDTPRIVSVELDGTEINDTLYETTDANPLKVWFNLAGLQHLKDNAGSTVTVTFAGELQSVGDGNISNVASYRVNHAPIEYPEDCDPTADDCDPTVPEEPKEPGDPDPDCEENCDPTTPEVNTYWGDLKINKVDAGDGSTGLTGAEFKVFEASDPYATDCATTTQGDEVTFGIDDNDNEITRVFTSEDGEVHVDGLYISDSENENSQQARCYWIEETAAPTGYQLDPEPAQAVTVNVGTTSGIDLTIKNTKQEVPELPLTGGQGTALLIGGGAALIALGAVLYVVRRRKSAQL
jgi:LPXTG-motif cell wall-anchored protein